MGFGHFWIQLSGARGEMHRCAPVAFSCYQRQAQARAGVVLLNFQSLFEQALGLILLEALQEEASPAVADLHALWMLPQRLAKLLVGFLNLIQCPQAFGADRWIRRSGQPRETGTGFGQPAVVAEGAAVVEFLG